jgi:small subunit ribosomal protein S17
MMAAEDSATQPALRRRHKELVGIVTAAKMQKTIVVKVTRRFQHRLYDRFVRMSKKFYAHDEQGEAKLGDTVRIVESRPLSKLKRWRLAEVVARRTRVD